MWFFKEFYYYIKNRKRYWMIPVYAFLLLFAILLLIGQIAPTVAPFIYTLY